MTMSAKQPRWPIHDKPGQTRTSHENKRTTLLGASYRDLHAQGHGNDMQSLKQQANGKPRRSLQAHTTNPFPLSLLTIMARQQRHNNPFPSLANKHPRNKLLDLRPRYSLSKSTITRTASIGPTWTTSFQPRSLQAPKPGVKLR